MVIIHGGVREVRGDVFYYKLFYSATLRLRVHKNILPENGRISLVNNQGLEPREVLMQNILLNALLSFEFYPRP